jgi:hypothetical protein
VRVQGRLLLLTFPAMPLNFGAGVTASRAVGASASEELTFLQCVLLAETVVVNSFSGMPLANLHN